MTAWLARYDVRVASTPDVIVLLEAGAICASAAVDALHAALGADPRNGIAVPSTNRAGNAQCCFPAAGADDVEATAGVLTRGFGDDVRVLEDPEGFCTAIRPALIDAIGEPDQTGEGWATAYAARAAQAGFRTVWVCAAYVYRPDTATSDGAPTPEVRVVRSRWPLLSCVMPTRNRAAFALHAVSLFRRQDYENLELVVLDDGDDELEAMLPDDPRIRYARTTAGRSIGTKRNEVCALARGDFVIQWDDDDWHGPRRCSIQMAPLLSGRADVTALRAGLWLDLTRWGFWTVSDALHRRMFVEDVSGGTLAFARSVWERMAKYPDAELAEDAAFLRQAVGRGARLERLEAPDQYIYVRHATNTWQLDCGSFLDPDGWRPAPAPGLDAADRAFYRSYATATADLPLVTCMMPTANRRAHVSRSIALFLRQDYANRELLVLDDGEDRVEDLMPGDPRVRYVGLERRLVLGEKRNRGCELARGEIVVHWDDDDWQAPNRLSYQVGALRRHGAGMCGLNRVLFFDPAAARGWLYEYPASLRRWLAGGSLCYLKDTWAHNRFQRVAVGEDARFVWSPSAGTQLILDNHRIFAALVHPANTSPRQPARPYWHERPFGEIRELLGEDLASFAPGNRQLHRHATNLDRK